MNKVELLGLEFHFGIGFLTELLENTGLTLVEIGERMDSGDVTVYRNLVYYSRLYSVKRKYQQPDFDFFTIDDLIDENGGVTGEFIKDFSKALLDSLSKDVPVDDNKKKVTKAKK